ncbi:MAG: YafY family transcriptional regulator [Clostridiales bacterium]|jgi:predicted DNA-binding transcriptional regulator YafY|nr:YafY family transcriptional regulator [Clostridiales bacterium]
MNTVILSIYFTLLNKRRVTREYLSDKFEISTRTVSRYIDVLAGSGVPVLASPGSGGGYYIPDDYRLERGCLSDAEIGRLLAALKATDKSFDDSLNDALIQKIGALGAGRTDGAMKSLGFFVIDAGPWSNAHDGHRAKIDAVSRAVTERKSLSISYTDRFEASTERTVDPYNLVLKEGVWYMYAFCRSRKSYRLFKLSRISGLVVTENEFLPRSDADVYEKISGQFDNAHGAVDLTIEFSCTILPQIEEWLGCSAIYEHGINYRASATLGGGQELLAKLLSFGSGVKILSPAALREELLVECKRVLNNC